MFSKKKHPLKKINLPFVVLEFVDNNDDADWKLLFGDCCCCCWFDSNIAVVVVVVVVVWSLPPGLSICYYHYPKTKNKKRRKIKLIFLNFQSVKNEDKRNENIALKSQSVVLLFWVKTKCYCLFLWCWWVNEKKNQIDFWICRVIEEENLQKFKFFFFVQNFSRSNWIFEKKGKTPELKINFIKTFSNRRKKTRSIKQTRRGKIFLRKREISR